MRVEILQPIVEATSFVVGSLLGGELSRGEMSTGEAALAHNITLSFELSGEVEGVCVLGMPTRLASRLAAVVLKQAVITFDQIATRALGDVGSLIASASIERLAAAGFGCAATATSVVRGASLRLGPSPVPVICVPFEGPLRERLDLSLRLTSARARAA